MTCREKKKNFSPSIYLLLLSVVRQLYNLEIPWIVGSINSLSIEAINESRPKKSIFFSLGVLCVYVFT